MRIDEIKGAGSSKNVKKKGSSVDHGFSSLFNSEPEEVTSPQASFGVGALASLDGLLNIEEVDDFQTIKKEQVQHGQQLLDYLDELRYGLLNGHIDANRVKEMANEARKTIGKSDDDRLNTILDEIELRAEVELAKLEIRNNL